TAPGLQGDRSSGGTKPAPLGTAVGSRSRRSVTRATWSAAKRPPARTRNGPGGTGAPEPGAPRTSRGPGLPLPAREGEEVVFERTIPARTDRLSTRTRERIRALDVLFEADARELSALEVLDERLVRTAAQSPLPPRA